MSKLYPDVNQYRPRSVSDEERAKEEARLKDVIRKEIASAIHKNRDSLKRGETISFCIGRFGPRPDDGALGYWIRNHEAFALELREEGWNAVVTGLISLPANSPTIDISAKDDA